MSLDLHFHSLFPAKCVFWHIIEDNQFFLELRKLTFFNAGFLADRRKAASVVNDSHGFEFLMNPAEDSAAPEVGVEKVLAMSTVWHAVVNN